MAADPVAGMQNTLPSTAGCGLPSVRSPAGLPFSLMHSARGCATQQLGQGAPGHRVVALVSSVVQTWLWREPPLQTSSPPKPKAPAAPNVELPCPGQKRPVADVIESPEVLSGFRGTAKGDRRV